MNTFTRKRSDEEIKDLQEKKNYQDFVNQTNQSLQELRTLIQSQNKMILQIKAKIDSDITNLFSEFENLESTCKDTFKEYQKEASDLKFNVSGNLDLINRTKRDFEFRYVQYDKYIEQTNIFHFDIIWLKERLKAAFDSIKVCENLLTGKIDEASRKIIENLVPDNSPTTELIDMVQEHVDKTDVNLAGLALEIARLKKSVNYGEKKFENIYTLIDRMKEGENVAGG